jgi:hypothetical protein
MTSMSRLEKSVHRCRLRASGVFLALRWTTLEKVPGVSVVRHWLYLATKVLGVGPTKRCLIPSLQWSVVPFLGMLSPQTWIFVAVLTIQVPAVSVLEALGHGCKEPGRVPSWVTRMGCNRHPSVLWVQDPDSSP